MKKVDLIVYRDKIRKLHKAAVELKKAHDEYSIFQDERLIGEDFDTVTDMAMLKEFFNNNPESQILLDEVETIIQLLA